MKAWRLKVKKWRPSPYKRCSLKWACKLCIENRAWPASTMMNAEGSQRRGVASIMKIDETAEGWLTERLKRAWWREAARNRRRLPVCEETRDQCMTAVLWEKWRRRTMQRNTQKWRCLKMPVPGESEQMKWNYESEEYICVQMTSAEWNIYKWWPGRERRARDIPSRADDGRKMKSDWRNSERNEGVTMTGMMCLEVTI